MRVTRTSGAAKGVRSRPAAPGPVRGLRRERPPRESRKVDPDARPGGRDARATSPVHATTHPRERALRRAHGCRRRGGRGDEPEHLGRPPHHDHGAHLALHPRVLAEPHAPAPLRGRAPLAPVGRRRDHPAPHPPGGRGEPRRGGGHRALHACIDARVIRQDYIRTVRANRIPRASRRLQARPAERAQPGAHDHRPPVRLPAGRLGDHRDDLLVAGVGRLMVNAIYTRDYPVIQGASSSSPCRSSSSTSSPISRTPW